ncbi:hetero-diels-alderase asR5 [Physcia stellaris]|nr:hetero-diels-alderase asR5 [Physcia stellaris]
MKLFSTASLHCLLISSVIPFTSAYPASEYNTASSRKPLPLSVEVVHEFPHGTWVENLAVRSNGKVLVDILTSPDIYQIDPFTKKAPILVHHFSEHLGLLGITETTQDIFYLVAGNYSAATNTNPVGAYDVYEVDVRKGAKQARINKIANFPKAGLLNGVTTLNAKKGLILIADSGAGLVYKLNVKTRQIHVVLDDPTMDPTAAVPYGINGIHLRDGALFFTNGAQGIFAKFPISPDGVARGPVTVISREGFSDDFCFDGKGDAFFAQNSDNNLGFLGPEGGKVTVLTGAPLTDKTLLAGPTACQFGRLAGDKKSLYITTSGGQNSNASTPTLGAQLTRVNLASSGYYNKGS